MKSKTYTLNINNCKIQIVYIHVYYTDIEHTYIEAHIEILNSTEIHKFRVTVKFFLDTYHRNVYHIQGHVEENLMSKSDHVYLKESDKSTTINRSLKYIKTQIANHINSYMRTLK